MILLTLYSKMLWKSEHTWGWIQNWIVTKHQVHFQPIHSTSSNTDWGHVVHWNAQYFFGWQCTEEMQNIVDKFPKPFASTVSMWKKISSSCFTDDLFKITVNTVLSIVSYVFIAMDVKCLAAHVRNLWLVLVQIRLQFLFSCCYQLQGCLEKSLKWLLINYQILLPNFLVFSCEWLGEFDIASKVT